MSSHKHLILHKAEIRINSQLASGIFKLSVTGNGHAETVDFQLSKSYASRMLDVAQNIYRALQTFKRPQISVS